MAVVLFNKDGQSKICNEFSYLHLLEQGWFYTPEECYVEEKQDESDETGPEETPGEEELETEEEITKVVVWIPNPDFGPPRLSDNEIRAAAKEAGISHWHTKSIDRLENELKDLENAERS